MKNCETCDKAWTDECEREKCFRNNYQYWVEQNNSDLDSERNSNEPKHKKDSFSSNGIVAPLGIIPKVGNGGNARIEKIQDGN